MSTVDRPNYPRTEGGRFGPGNPGRMPNSRNAVSRKAMSHLHDLSDAALEGLTAAVTAGDFKAISYVIDRLIPSGRIVQLDPTTEGIKEAIQDGDLSISELRELAQALSGLKALTELETLRNEVEDLRRLLRG